MAEHTCGSFAACVVVHGAAFDVSDVCSWFTREHLPHVYSQSSHSSRGWADQARLYSLVEFAYFVAMPVTAAVGNTSIRLIVIGRLILICCSYNRLCYINVFRNCTHFLVAIKDRTVYV